jgi:hypothetical protein
MADPDFRLLTIAVNNQIRGRQLPGEQLNSGGGGGTSGGMEARVARLESDMEHVKKSVADIATDMKSVRTSLGDIKVDLGRFDERLKHMPTKGFIFATSAAMVGVTSAIVALVVKMMN